MSGFDLVPVDGGDPVHLPAGETVLGRGPFLGVSDKRVSRHHGLLENLNGQLRLKPIHLNPCFVQSSLSDEPRPLQKDSWHLLHHGDLFSLLPGRFVYEVVAVGGGERTPRNSQMFEEEEELQLSPAAGQDQDQNQSPPQEVPTPAAPSNREEASSPSLKQRDSARLTEDDQRDVAPSVTRRRVLPAWMMAAVAAPKPSSSLKAPPTVKGGKSPAVSVSSKRAVTTKATPTASSSPVEAELSEEEEERPRKRKRKTSNKEEKPQTDQDVPSEEPSRAELSAESDDFPAATAGKGNDSTRTSEVSEPGRDRKSKKELTAKEVESVASNGSSASKLRVRTPCPYGKDCYRKNPLHFQECSHPGDTDHEEEEEEEEEEENRPECPYGTDCYRKNPLHKKEYKHTRRPVSAARSKRPVAKNLPDEDEEDDDFGDDDSFINDDSEDVGDDSDYVPPDSDDSGREDVKRLQREASTFLKRRK